MQGLEVYDSIGALKISVTNRLPKIIGSIRVTSNGNVSYSAPQGNDIFVMFVADFFAMDKGLAYPSVKIMNGLISWSYDNRDYPISSYVPGTLVYGCY